MNDSHFSGGDLVCDGRYRFYLSLRFETQRNSSRSALAMQAEHDYSEASISLEGAVSPFEVDALITATALDRDAASLTSKDWVIGLFFHQCSP